MSLTKIFITGANKGLGYYASKEIVARPNVHLIVSCRGSWTNGLEASALADIKSVVHEDSKLDAIDEVDVTNDEALEKAVKQLAILTDNCLDVLINNAGINLRDKNLSVREIWTEIFNTNVFGTVVLTELTIPLLKASTKKPRIFNIISDLGSMKLRGDPSWIHYGLPFSAYPSSKSSLNAYTVYLSVAHRDIITVSWNPGYTKTTFNNFQGTANPVVVGKQYADAIFDPNIKSGTYFGIEGEIPCMVTGLSLAAW